MAVPTPNHNVEELPESKGSNLRSVSKDHANLACVLEEHFIAYVSEVRQRHTTPQAEFGTCSWYTYSNKWLACNSATDYGEGVVVDDIWALNAFVLYQGQSIGVPVRSALCLCGDGNFLLAHNFRIRQ